MRGAEKKPQTVQERIQALNDRWFIREPLLMLVISSHKLESNTEIKTIRTGKGSIEYNESFLSNLEEAAFEKAFTAEAIRILLRHPYRHPPGNAAVAYIASNITLNEYYNNLELPYHVEDFWPEQNSRFRRQNFEFYYHELLQQAGDSNENALPNITAEQIQTNAENASLWQENEFLDLQITTMIENFKARNHTQWGSIKGELFNVILALMKPVCDYRYVLSGFRATLLSSKRTLTRMKPSRRYGFLFMGQKYRFSTKLLIGVDVSGSISHKELQLFYSTINRFFKYGIERIDAVAFDYVLQGDPIVFTKARQSIKIKGRGGTNFQPIIDLFESGKNMYDGLIIFTDGYASQPKITPSLTHRIAWICSNKDNYNRHKNWMEQLGRCCFLR